MNKKLPVLLILTTLFTVSLYFQVKNTLAVDIDNLVTPPVTSPVSPSVTPSLTPSVTPSTTPSATPSLTPSVTPSSTPSLTPSVTPSTTPSGTPSVSPTMTPTVTPTPPVTQTSISGNVFTEILGRLMHGVNRFSPAANVTVMAQEIFTHHTFSTHTDANGNYSMTVDPGYYFVSASNANNTFFVPTLRFANTKQHNASHEDFKGLIFQFGF